MLRYRPDLIVLDFHPVDEPLLGAAEMPHAICSNFSCGYNIKLHNIESGLSRETPKECPRCAFPMISICPECKFLLTGNPLAIHCSLCHADLKAVFAMKKGSPQSSQGLIS